MEIERKQYKCMTCGEIYEEGNLPTIKDKIGDGCCSIGSLIEINENKIESGKFPKTNIESDNTIGDMKVYGTIDKRYYTPTLDEFKLRFEYEFKDWFTQYGIDAITGIRRSDWQKTEIKEEAYWSTEAVERMNGGKYGPRLSTYLGPNKILY